jgi:hypothetical protein
VLDYKPSTGSDDKKKDSLVGKKILIDGKPISQSKGGNKESVSGVEVKRPAKKKYTGKARNPGATAKAIMGSGDRKRKTKPNTNYKSTRSKKGKPKKQWN